MTAPALGDDTLTLRPPSPVLPATRIPTLVRATDPLLRDGIRAQLRQHPQIVLRDGTGDDDVLNSGAAVAVVAGDQVNDDLMQILRTTLRHGYSRVVLIAGRLDDASVFAALEAGVCGILSREEVTGEQLVRAVSAAANGHGFVPPDVLGRILDQVGRLQRQVLTPRGLTMSPLRKREIDVLRLLADGADTAEIARELAYSERTIKNIIHDVTVRMGLKNRTHAVAYAVREGLI
jgi:DNA-binding NarL/FixJ family response regulator